MTPVSNLIPLMYLLLAPLPRWSKSSVYNANLNFRCLVQHPFLKSQPISSMLVWCSGHRVPFLNLQFLPWPLPALLLWSCMRAAPFPLRLCPLLGIPFFFFFLNLLSKLTLRPSLDDTSSQKFSLNAPSWIRYSSFVLVYRCKHQKIHCKWA